MDYKIVGDVMQALQVELHQNEELYAEAGAMLYMGAGIDLQALIACARRVQEILGRPLGSHTLVAGPVEWG